MTIRHPCVDGEAARSVGDVRGAKVPKYLALRTDTVGMKAVLAHKLALVLAFVSAGLLVGACGVLGSPTPPVLADITGLLAGEDTLLVRLVHITDSHITDTQSPGRLAKFDVLVSPAWRPQEAYATQLLDGMIRNINRYHEEVGRIDLLIHGGDAVDNAQQNELRWFLQVMDGQTVTPRSGPDERDPSDLPPPLLDPYESFQAEGLYTQGRHGPLPTIPWYAVVGNHDVYAAGNFPILARPGNRRISLLPLPLRPGTWLPRVLMPDGEESYGLVSLADPSPPPLFGPVVEVEPNPDRAFCTRQDLLEAHLASQSSPIGHGFTEADGPCTWYSRLVAETVRLIALDTTDVPLAVPGMPYPQGAISRRQLRWLKSELAEAAEQGQWVIIATHHPSGGLTELYGSAVSPREFRELLNASENVVLHLSGHVHENRVLDWGGYIEIKTASTLDYPQVGRIIEIHQEADSGEVLIQYATFSHRDSDDPLSALREVAFDLARADAGVTVEGVPE